jgi:hypothetical protein
LLRCARNDGVVVLDRPVNPATAIIAIVKVLTVAISMHSPRPLSPEELVSGMR